MSKHTTTQFKQCSLYGWCLFDFANSIAAVIGGIYFSKWFIEDVGASSVLLNVLFFLSALVIILVGKVVGKQIDSNGYESWIVMSSVLAVLAIIMLFLGAQALPGRFLIPFSFLVYLLFLFGYQVGRICHNVYLKRVIPNHLQSVMSGFGAASNWGGSVVGILLSLPVVIAFPNMYGRELTFVVAAIGYGLLTVIAVRFMFASKTNSEEQSCSDPQRAISWNTLFTSVGSSLLVYFLLFDTMFTVERNLPTYLSRVVEMRDDAQAVGFFVVLLCAMMGGFVAAKYVTNRNSLVWLRTWSLLLAISIAAITIRHPVALWGSFALAGLSYGILESAIRVNFMGKFSMRNAGQNFGALMVVERSSGVLGPVVWIIPFLISNIEVKSYIASMLFLSVLAFVACLILFIIPNRRLEN